MDLTPDDGRALVVHDTGGGEIADWEALELRWNASGNDAGRGGAGCSGVNASLSVFGR